MAIYFYNLRVKDPLPTMKKKLTNWIKKVLGFYYKQPGNINIIFCTNEYLRKINKTYLKHNYYTDVITFSYDSGKKISGDIFISLQQVKDNANIYSVSFETELLRVIIHGILHLIGFDDKNVKEEKIMRKNEDFALKLLHY
jgi:rRNA maturation RNase YbeY